MRVNSTEPTDDARIQQAIQALRDQDYPPAVVCTMGAYLSGEAPLAPARAAWEQLDESLRRRWPAFLANDQFEQAGAQLARLSAYDRRVIDLGVACQHAEALLYVAWLASAYDAMWTVLRQAGVPYDQLMARLLYEIDPTPTRRAILIQERWRDNLRTYTLIIQPLKSHLDEIVALASAQWDDADHWLRLLGALMAHWPYGTHSRPPEYFDAVLRVAQRLPQGALGQGVLRLLKGDIPPPLFWEWASTVAEPDGPGNHDDQMTALAAIVRYSWRTNALDDARVERSLRRAIAEGDPALAAQAADALLHSLHTHAPDDAYVEALTLLTHRYDSVRKVAGQWLIVRFKSPPTLTPERLLADLAPQLAHPSADARLAVAQVIRRIGGVGAYTLLVGRLTEEKASGVRAFLLGATGNASADATAADGAASYPTPPERIALLAAEATRAESAARAHPLPWLAELEAQLTGGARANAAASSPRWVTGEPLTEATLRYLLRRQSQTSQPQVEESVRAWLPLLDHDSLGDWALALAQGWRDHGDELRQMWTLPLACALGDDRVIAPLIGYVDAQTQVISARETTTPLRSSAAKRSVKVIQALGLLGDLPALLAIHPYAGCCGRPRRLPWSMSYAAGAILNAAVERLGIARAELCDRCAPTLGLDANSERIVALSDGPDARRFILRLGLDGAPHLIDGVGRELRTLPRPRADEDAPRAEQARGDWQMLKKQARKARQFQAARLATAQREGRRWRVSAWRDIFGAHPLLRTLACGLVWGVFGADAALALTFRPLGDGTLTDAHDRAITLPAGDETGDGETGETGESGVFIRLVRADELSAPEQATWLQSLADYDVVPPFAQFAAASM